MIFMGNCHIWTHHIWHLTMIWALGLTFKDDIMSNDLWGHHRMNHLLLQLLLHSKLPPRCHFNGTFLLTILWNISGYHFMEYFWLSFYGIFLVNILWNTSDDHFMEYFWWTFCWILCSLYQWNTCADCFDGTFFFRR